MIEVYKYSHGIYRFTAQLKLIVHRNWVAHFMIQEKVAERQRRLRPVTRCVEDDERKNGRTEQQWQIGVRGQRRRIELRSECREIASPTGPETPCLLTLKYIALAVQMPRPYQADITSSDAVVEHLIKDNSQRRTYNMYFILTTAYLAFRFFAAFQYVYSMH